MIPAGAALDDLVSDFIAETREGLEALDSELVRFEQQPDDPETLSGIFRLIHTIKGTCGFLGLMRLQTVAHAAENVLGGFRDGVVPVTPTAVSAVLDTVDLIRSLVDALASTGAEPEGDDSALIGRLEAVMETAAGDEPAAAAPTAEAPQPAAKDARSLIEQLGGDATLDAAAEMSLARLRDDARLGGLFARADTDRLLAAVRDGLCGIARKGEASDALARALAQVADGAVDAGAVGAVFDVAAAALADLEVDAAAIAALRSLACPPPEPRAEADPEPALAEAEPEASSAPDPEPALEASPAPVAATAPAARSAPPAAGGEAAGPAQTIRVSVDALEHLMTVVSELVLIRNQLIQTLRLEPESPFAAPLNRLNQVTSELQEGVMTTRMQPISGAWAKLPRLVRDLAQDLGKSIDLVMLGQETELDRQVLELIKDPLTHMIRNAADHGLETPAERRAAGKPETGRITLQARHEGGAIVIEVADDGRGLSAEKIRAKALASGLITPTQAEQMSDADARQLIFLPGFSTASQVTAVSGRGVGMDVVRTNIEKIGGAIEVGATDGGGTRFTIRIPLTLTIVSALIVECCGERFAMPQSAVVELVSASGASGHAIEYIDGSAVLRLRDRLLPLVSLQSLLGLEPVGEPSNETCILVARVGAFTFGVIVDRVFDTEEIVVKPVATVLRHLKLYSGATILGDGSVILILDPKGISLEAGAGQTGSLAQDDADALGGAGSTSREALLVFRAANETLKAARLATVSRIEELAADQIERVDGRAVVQYRGRLMPVLGVDAQPAAAWEGEGRRPLLVFAQEDRAVGLLVDEIVDIVESSTESELGSRGEGAAGSLIIGGKATELIDVGYYWARAVNDDEPARPAGQATSAGPAAGPASMKRLLVIDSSPFSQLLLRPLLAQAGYDVTVATDPEAALGLYESGEHFHLIMADTSSGEPDMKAFAKAFAQAPEWHRTPLLSLALHNLKAAGAGGLDTTTLLDAVSGALDEMKGAA
ncbi:Chemotaxis histidine kinase [Phenylobacterium zucineum HLK1]|uniref:Chemotaxis protein CheA n=1 Tax=Phenylobacterium zucineum (strain HLK1) TaxID=450851 RepID=B4RAP5_PHEZH|nr:Chemotaxis histidine kinase [Phenylobacterium zucineum HLK1]